MCKYKVPVMTVLIAAAIVLLGEWLFAENIDFGGILSTYGGSLLGILIVKIHNSGEVSNV